MACLLESSIDLKAGICVSVFSKAVALSTHITVCVPAALLRLWLMALDLSLSLVCGPAAGVAVIDERAQC